MSAHTTIKPGQLWRSHASGKVIRVTRLALSGGDTRYRDWRVEVVEPGSARKPTYPKVMKEFNLLHSYELLEEAA